MGGGGPREGLAIVAGCWCCGCYDQCVDGWVGCWGARVPRMVGGWPPHISYPETAVLGAFFFAGRVARRQREDPKVLLVIITAATDADGVCFPGVCTREEGVW